MRPDEPKSSPRPYDDRDWLAGRCPIRVVADAIRGDADKLRMLTFLAAVWANHEPHCTATER
jgi:hypothetical protein